MSSHRVSTDGTGRKRKSFKLRSLLCRWHRRMGLAAALLVLVVSVTGIQLNHVDSLLWDQKPVRSTVLMSLYGVKTPQISSFSVGSTWLSHLGADHLYVNQSEAVGCRGKFVGALAYQQLIVAACGDEIILLTQDGDLIERIGAVYNVPTPLEKIGLCPDIKEPEQLCLQSQGRIHHANIEQLRWPVLPDEKFVPSTEALLPAALRESLLEQHFSGGITWERVVLDLHSGRLFGLGPWLMDLVAVLLILLSLSGIVLWAQGRAKRTRRSR